MQLPVFLDISVVASRIRLSLIIFNGFPAYSTTQSGKVGYGR